jgi:hypothetical protein
VYNIGEERKTRGSYITEQKKKMREITESHESDYDAEAFGSGGEAWEKGESPSQDAPPADSSKKDDDEPISSGFILE